MVEHPPVEGLLGDCVSLAEHRQQERREVSLKLPLSILGAPNQPEIKVQVHNLSTRGMGFRARRDFTIAAHLAVRFPAIMDRQRLVLCQVKHSRMTAPGTFEIGAEFVESATLAAGAAVPARWVQLARQ